MAVVAQTVRWQVNGLKGTRGKKAVPTAKARRWAAARCFRFAFARRQYHAGSSESIIPIFFIQIEGGQNQNAILCTDSLELRNELPLSGFGRTPRITAVS